MDYKIEVEFGKNIPRPEYGNEAYYTDYCRIFIPFGNKEHFKRSASAVKFVKSKIDANVLSKYNNVSIAVMHGGGGHVEYLKHDANKGDGLPLERMFAESLLTY